MKGFMGSGAGSNVNRFRLIGVGVLFASIFLAYLIHLFSMQVINTLFYQKQARDVSKRSDIIPAQRGRIYDRNYDYPLAMNVDSFALALTPAEVEGISIEEMIERISSIINVSASELMRKVPRSSSNRYQAVEIVSGVSFDNVAYIAEHIDEFPGISWTSKPLRWYNETGSISHVLGYIGGITTSELQVLYNEGYSYDSVLGKSGIEKQYDRILRGTDGRRIKTVDVKGRNTDQADSIEPPENGMNLRLTIDRNIQLLAEKALGKRKGSVVVLQPSTGEVLALVSYPYFNPNLFSLPGPTNFGVLSLDPDFPFLNRAIQSQYPPASTFKLVLSAALLDLDAVDPEKTVTCEGEITIGNRTTYCHKKSGHGPVNLKEALAESCNIYFGTMGMEVLGIDNIATYAQYLGLAAATEIDLPGEVSGNIPTKAWKQSVYNNSWQLGDTYNAAIGQGFVTSTPLQVANEIAMIVNNGIAYKPHILKEVIDPLSGEVLERMEPEVLRTSPIRYETFQTLKENMRGVITDGTSNVVILNKQVEIAGKTGTGEVGSDENWHSWFASYGPYDTDNPEERVVVLTMVEATNDWEWWAPKAADIIYEGIFGNKTYEEVVRDFRKRRVWYSWDAHLEEDDNGGE
ncbi:penicillin-binding protein 2 [Spirochaeta isovalerica]|uniref:Penicillin-binding protein 2 n=1 Tax=Spirochaeta isovalerica TaxID=150 RepID=A0A841R8N3_9SPIO|nr:penicillin-binding protein 2 [Spirochaeta isovalerica]MBB6479088.1 penicillin-binding protein 2 [Spirochaeta isovalerica]